MSIHPPYQQETCQWEIQADDKRGLGLCGKPAELAVVLHNGEEECLCRVHVLEHLNQVLHAFADIPRRD